MIILDKAITKDELKRLSSNFFGDMIKVVVDVDRNLVALDAELHSDLEALLIDNGSRQESLWGINLYPDIDIAVIDEFIEFDSLINIRPTQDNPGRYVESEEIRDRICKIVISFIS